MILNIPTLDEIKILSVFAESTIFSTEELFHTYVLLCVIAEGEESHPVFDEDPFIVLQFICDIAALTNTAPQHVVAERVDPKTPALKIKGLQGTFNGVLCKHVDQLWRVANGRSDEIN